MANETMKQMTKELNMHYDNTEALQNIIMNCSLTAAAASAVGGFVPVLSIPTMVVSCFGAVWTMYIKLCKQLGINLKENILKILARAALTNMTTNLAWFLAGDLVLSFIPGAGIVTSALLTFVTVYLAGKMFLAMITKFAKQGVASSELANMTVTEMQEELESHTPDRQDVLDAKRSFRENYFEA